MERLLGSLPAAGKETLTGGAGGSGRYNFSPVAIRKGEREDREEQKRTKYFERKKPQV